jgi:group I intron endonuclease
MVRTKFPLKESGVYKIESKINGKIYIGSAVCFASRWLSHKHDLRKNKHHSLKLQRHYNKYGEDDLIFAIVCHIPKKPDEPLTEFKERLLAKEQFYLSTANTSFNICKIAKNCMGRAVSQETREKIRKKLLGKPGHMQGKHLSNETKIKIGIKSKGNKHCLGHITPQIVRDKIKISNIKYWNSKKGKQIARDRSNKFWNSPAGEIKKEKLKHNYLSPESKIKISNTLKNKYKK